MQQLRRHHHPLLSLFIIQYTQSIYTILLLSLKLLKTQSISQDNAAQRSAREFDTPYITYYFNFVKVKYYNQQHTFPFKTF